MKPKVPAFILDIAPYVPGKPIETLAREYGIESAVKLASNENPLGPSPKSIAAIERCLSNLHRYPDGAGYALVQKIAALQQVPAESIILGNGSDDIIGMLTRALLQPGDEIVVPQPSFSMYDLTARWCGAHTVAVPLVDYRIDLNRVLAAVGDRCRLIFLCNPNNPTGTIFSRSDFDSFLEALPPEVVVVIDEAYAEFVRDPQYPRGADYLDAPVTVATLRTFSKAYGLAGLRIGYGVMAPELAAVLHRVRMPFNVNTPAQAGALAALDDSDFLARTVALVHSGLDTIYAALKKMGIRCYPSEANFLLIDVRAPADEVYQKLLYEGVITRSMTSYGYPQFIRINVGKPEENERFLSALKKVLST